MTFRKTAAEVMDSSATLDISSGEPMRRRLPWAVVVALVALYAATSLAALATIGNPSRAGLRELFGQSLGTVGRMMGPAFETRASLAEEAASQGAAAKARIANGDLPAAAAAYRKRLLALQELADRDETDTVVRREIFVTQMALGLLAESTERLPDARQAYRAAITVLRPVAEEHPDNIGWQNDMAEAQDRLDALDAGQGLNASE